MAAKTDTKDSKKTDKDDGFATKLARFFADQRTKYGIGILLLGATFYLALSFISFLFTGATDDSIIQQSYFKLEPADKRAIQNWAGPLGAYWSAFFINKGFGIASFAWLYLSFIVALRFMKVRLVAMWKAITVSLLALIWISTAVSFFFSSLYTDHDSAFYIVWGGVHGETASRLLVDNIKSFGTFIILMSSLLVFCIFAYNGTIPFLQRCCSTTGNNLKALFTPKPKAIKDTPAHAEIPAMEIQAPTIEDEEEETFEVFDATENSDDEWIVSNDAQNDEFEIVVPHDEAYSPPADDDLEPLSPVLANAGNTNDDEKYDALAELGEYDPTLDLSRYKLPTLELLKDYGSSEGQVNFEEQNANKNRIITTLKNFGIDTESIKATVGPTITLYEIVPKAGVRISKIKNLESDIMLSLAATGIRIIAPIPGKGTIGIEVPNNDPQTVSMLSIIGSKKFQESKFQLPIAFGRTITNDIFMVDLCKMPHLLVAGATGQGKSVGLNAIITSLLYKKHPAYLKFVLVDPKKVEFNIYSKIEKHFLAKLPDGDDAIITDVSKVVQTLNSLTKEMDDRYDLLKKAHVRNISEYNDKFIHRHLNPEKGHRFLPYIVVIIDEFGDLIMVAGKEVELPIARIAQLARAVGIHMIIATQRPSVNIITGVIKANFPARVAFRVSSQIDSRTILDASGANQLVGRGDMLFSQGSDLVRVQCAFVDTPEVEKISDFIGNQPGYPTAFYLPEYVGETGEGSDLSDVDLSRRDPMFEESARLLVAHQQGSTSLIQRKFSIGYNRAGRIMDQLEAAGIVGPFQGSKARDVLIPDDYSLEQKLLSL
ncbi:MAG: DNA translocase FtsK [Prevotellaceae bacterium]|jgi:S-DNA-T family DNA segregation ATPase FtsK/SpoIIIE|nr:DNA translocase FtsK [Prevotellaceae bacterium]